MKTIHNRVAGVIFLLVSILFYWCEGGIYNTTAQVLVTFFSVVFGFYMTSIAILYNASYTKSLHKKIDEKEQKRGTHILKSYLLRSGHCSILSVSLIILFTTFATENNSGALSSNFSPWVMPFITYELNLNLLLSSVLFGIASINIFYMLLLMRVVINGLLEEAKK